MYKISSILLGLAFAIGAVSAAKNDTDTVRAYSEADLGLVFYNAWYNKGVSFYCLKIQYDQCYTFEDDIIASGISSVTFDNYSIWAKRFSLTLYSGLGCNDRYDRWSFTHDFQEPPYDIIAFPTLNDQVRSFKVANFHTSRQSGRLFTPPEDSVMSGCQLSPY